MVSYLSHGRVLVIGDEEAALDAARHLDSELVPTLVVPSPDGPSTGTLDGLTVVRGPGPQLDGSLGNFTIRFAESSEAPAAPKLVTQARFDLVLDVGKAPLLSREVPPPGYYATRREAPALEAALAELPDMRGEFEKPKYFNYDPNICAHGRRGVRGCTRCLDACPASAITSVGERISVDPNVCQGFGSCATVCPTGAITYAFPSTGDLLGYLRQTLVRYRDGEGSDPVLMFYDSASPDVANIAESLPENVLPLELEEIGSLGMDAWLCCLAWGVRRVLILAGPDTPASIRDVLARETALAGTLLDAMGYPSAAVQLCDSSDVDSAAAQRDQWMQMEHAAKFAPAPEKQVLFRLAMDHLLENAPHPRKSVALPAGAPFGRVKVDGAACTLCMSCVAVCPASALREGQGLPQLKFVEDACVQCGMCVTACPEDAVTRETRFLFDAEERSKVRLLHEEQPACCISCGKPFATRSMLDVMAKKLEGHWMFQGEAEKRRLEMCEDCRVRDMMR
jgi:ferredoxin